MHSHTCGPSKQIEMYTYVRTYVQLRDCNTSRTTWCISVKYNISEFVLQIILALMLYETWEGSLKCAYLSGVALNNHFYGTERYNKILAMTNWKAGGNKRTNSSECLNCTCISSFLWNDWVSSFCLGNIEIAESCRPVGMSAKTLQY
jgi:hypothetical protein